MRTPNTTSVQYRVDFWDEKDMLWTNQGYFFDYEGDARRYPEDCGSRRPYRVVKITKEVLSAD